MGFQDFALVLPAMMLLLGGTFAVMGIRYLVNWIGILRRFRVTCLGLVTDTRVQSRGSGTDSTLVEYPVLTFRTEDGREVQTLASNYSSVVRHEPGQQVKVTYDPANPLEAYTGGKAASWVVPVFALVFTLVGLVLLIYGCVVLVVGGGFERLLEVLA